MHNNVVIICDGAFPKTEYPRYLIRTADFIICCDGALKKFLRNSAAIFGETRLPDRVIGDMDSISAADKKKYSDIIVQVDEQEHNDQTKAFRWALENLSEISLENVNIGPFNFSDFPKLRYLYVSSDENGIVGGSFSSSIMGQYLYNTVLTLPDRSGLFNGWLYVRGVSTDSSQYIPAAISASNRTQISAVADNKNWKVIWNPEH